VKEIVFNADVVGPWVCRRTGGKFDGLGTAIGLMEDGMLIAGVLYDSYNGRSIAMHVASDGSKRWMTREYLRICFDYPFNQLGVNVIIGLVDSENLAARQFDEALGFKLEHTVPNAGPKGDLLLYSMTAAQCRFLHIKERERGRQERSTC
jgi:RimJ/RimL family protein N-acetyltransferase